MVDAGGPRCRPADDETAPAARSHGLAWRATWRRTGQRSDMLTDRRLPGRVLGPAELGKTKVFVPMRASSTAEPAWQPLLILDLDETLIHAADRPLTPPHDFRAGPYHVHRRPFLDEFIATVASAYRLAVWSSSSPDYVEFITHRIIPDGIPLAFAWSQTRCIQRYHPEYQIRYWVKDLARVKRLGYDIRRIIMVDDTPSKLERSYGNAVYISPFEGDPTDLELQLLGPYLLSLASCDNVRTLEKRHWRSWAMQHGQDGGDRSTVNGSANPG
jgi:hypothetical protein